jgi:hypothetical protein
MATWNEVTKDRWDQEFLRSVRPHLMTSVGILVSKPSGYKTCSAVGNERFGYRAIMRFEGKFYECDKALTAAEFRLVKPCDVVGSKAEGQV